MIERRHGADAHELARADLDHRHAADRCGNGERSWSAMMSLRSHSLPRCARTIAVRSGYFLAIRCRNASNCTQSERRWNRTRCSGGTGDRRLEASARIVDDGACREQEQSRRMSPLRIAHRAGRRRPVRAGGAVLRAARRWRPRSLLDERGRSGGDRRPRAGDGVRPPGRGPRDRGGARRQRRRSRQELRRSGARARRRRAGRARRARSTRRSSDANSAAAARRKLRARADHRRAGGHGRARRHRARRPVRVRRHPRRGARGHAATSAARRPTSWCSASRVVGIAITAGTYATIGAATPARVGLSAVKAARKTGRISARHGGLDRPLAARGGRLVGAQARRRRRSPSPRSRVRAAREAVKVEKADGLVRLVERRRPGADQGRHPGRARRAEARRGPARHGADRQARREEGQQDPRDPQDARPRRDPAVDRTVQSRGLDAGRDPDAVRLRVLGQERRRAADPARHRPQQGAAARALSGDDASSGLDPRSMRLAQRRRCRLYLPHAALFTMAPWSSPTSTRARASRSCWCTASPPPRR